MRWRKYWRKSIGLVLQTNAENAWTNMKKETHVLCRLSNLFQDKQSVHKASLHLLRKGFQVLVPHHSWKKIPGKDPHTSAKKHKTFVSTDLSHLCRSHCCNIVTTLVTTVVTAAREPKSARACNGAVPTMAASFCGNSKTPSGMNTNFLSALSVSGLETWGRHDACIFQKKQLLLYIYIYISQLLCPRFHFRITEEHVNISGLYCYKYQ